MSQNLLIVGASARAAAFSALRAGLEPCCIDLFADRDLHAYCPAVQIPASDYPRRLPSLARGQPPGPWMYTGGLEKYPAVVRAITRQRTLWGNDAAALVRLHGPAHRAKVLKAAGLPCPAVRLDPPGAASRRRWLVKPWTGAGGAGIRFWAADSHFAGQRRRCYFQEYIEGETCSALYLAAGQDVRLLGATRQLVGESWLHAAPFHYCGSMGPLRLQPGLRMALARLGTVLARGFALRGLFGVDFILREGVPWPVDVNPRYTASVEVLEHTLGISGLALHRRTFDATAPAQLASRKTFKESWIGKAVLFARLPLVFPGAGPWLETLDRQRAWESVPAFADIPAVGTAIAAGRPVLSLFARAESEAACRDRLQQIAKDLDLWLSRA